MPLRTFLRKSTRWWCHELAAKCASADLVMAIRSIKMKHYQAMTTFQPAKCCQFLAKLPIIATSNGSCTIWQDKIAAGNRQCSLFSAQEDEFYQRNGPEMVITQEESGLEKSRHRHTAATQGETLQSTYFAPEHSALMWTEAPSSQITAIKIAVDVPQTRYLPVVAVDRVVQFLFFFSRVAHANKLEIVVEKRIKRFTTS